MAEQFQYDNLIFAPSLLSLSRTVSLATSQLQVLYGSMESIFRDPVIAFQRGRPKRMVGMGVRGVMVVVVVV